MAIVTNASEVANVMDSRNVAKPTRSRIMGMKDTTRKDRKISYVVTMSKGDKRKKVNLIV